MGIFYGGDELPEGTCGQTLLEDLLKEELVGTHQNSFSLTSEQVSQIIEYRSIPAYTDFFEQYEKEKKSLSSNDSLQPEQSLTTDQREMLNGPSDTALNMKSHIDWDSHGRQIKLHTVESEGEHMRSCNSYVSAIVDDTLKFGRILLQDDETDLKYVFTSSLSFQ